MLCYLLSWRKGQLRRLQECFCNGATPNNLLIKQPLPQLLPLFGFALFTSIMFFSCLSLFPYPSLWHQLFSSFPEGRAKKIRLSVFHFQKRGYSGAYLLFCFHLSLTIIVPLSSDLCGQFNQSISVLLANFTVPTVPVFSFLLLFLRWHLSVFYFICYYFKLGR